MLVNVLLPQVLQNLTIQVKYANKFEFIFDIRVRW